MGRAAVEAVYVISAGTLEGGCDPRDQPQLVTDPSDGKVLWSFDPLG